MDLKNSGAHLPQPPQKKQGPPLSIKAPSTHTHAHTHTHTTHTHTHTHTHTPEFQQLFSPHSFNFFLRKFKPSHLKRSGWGGVGDKSHGLLIFQPKFGSGSLIMSQTMLELIK